MPITVKKGDEEDGGISGTGARGTVSFYTFGSDDVVACHTAALAAMLADPLYPLGYYRGLPLRESNYSRVAPKTWKFPFVWGLELNQAQPSTIPQPSDPSHASNIFKATRGFQCIGGTRHITTSLETTQTEVISGRTAVDFKKLINVEYSSDGNQATARGLDLLAGAPELTWTAQQPNSVMTAAYQRVIAEMTDPCHVNDDDFYGYERGELLFKGCTGQQHGTDLWQLTFVFLFAKNVEDFEISPDLPPIDKLGWQYAWILSELGSPRVNGRDTLRPVQVNVETVYPFGDFSTLLIGVG